jgi:hypothetical protein
MFMASVYPTGSAAVTARDLTARGILLSAMTECSCPYLVCEKTAFRGTLDLSAPPSPIVIVSWYCEHPFHGIRLDLGDARAEVEQLCAACTLPRPGSDEK